LALAELTANSHQRLPGVWIWGSASNPQGLGAGPGCQRFASPGRLPRVQAYKQNKEMLPKAAFQFGLKAGDGRKSSKDLTRKQDNKLSGQLRKIQARAVISVAGPEGGLSLAAERAWMQTAQEKMHLCLMETGCLQFRRHLRIISLHAPPSA